MVAPVLHLLPDGPRQLKGPHRTKSDTPVWDIFPNWPGRRHFALATPLPQGKWYQRIERRVHTWGGRELLHYDCAVPLTPVQRFRTKRLFFTRFVWYDAGAKQCTSRGELLTAWYMLLEAHDALYNAKCDVDMVVAECQNRVHVDDLLHDPECGLVTVLMAVEGAASTLHVGPADTSDHAVRSLRPRPDGVPR